MNGAMKPLEIHGALVTLPLGPEIRPLDGFWLPGRRRSPHLLIFVHGMGGNFYRSALRKRLLLDAPGFGFDVLTFNNRGAERDVATERFRDCVADLGAALAFARRKGYRSIVLMGHSAGAHLVVLVGTDPRYLDAEGVPRGSIRGIVPIDGAAYDVAAQLADAGRFMAETYGQAFGDDPARQRALSPTLQAGGWDAPRFLLLHVQRKDGIAQARALGAALVGNGVAVEYGSFPGTGLRGHAEINRSLGDPAYAATPVVDAWLRSVFGGG